jgi:hypothetical protein
MPLATPRHVSPEQSLLLHAANTAIPRHIIIYAAHGTNNTLGLPFSMSLYDLKSTMPPASDRTELDGIRLCTPEAALMKVSAAFLQRNPVEAPVVLAGVRDVSGLLRRMLDDGNSVIAGRLAGAFRKIGRDDAADEIIQTMRAAGFTVRETGPFSPDQVSGISRAAPSPTARRLESLWDSMRGPVISIFPAPPGLPPDSDAYLRAVDATYQCDAYNSLSIEGYRVSTELVNRVRSGGWDPDRRETDRHSRDALAARGYWQAFQRVRATMEAIITRGRRARPGAHRPPGLVPPTVPAPRSSGPARRIRTGGIPARLRLPSRLKACPASPGSRPRRHAGAWITPGRLEALIPGRIQSYGGTAEVPRGAAWSRGEDGAGGPGAGG